ncbi:MAG: NAD(P)/FAD-dependent oxidoreductase [Anaerolineaceae bacterium]|nr:NAD(P)/FAD-dependent oxidoreductase [Anaerolineaceae bacterium]
MEYGQQFIRIYHEVYRLKTKRIAIIGAGFGGLSAAYDLSRKGHQVVVYDSDDGPGGLARGFKEPAWKWSVEKYYHHWFASDQHVLGLINELGWRNKVIFPRPYTVMYYKDEFYPFDSIMTALTNPIIGWGLSKLRFGMIGLYLRLTTNWKALEKVSAESWMKKWAGQSVYEKMWAPLLQGKFGDRYMHDVNMAWMWARLHARTTRLGTFEGGFQAFANAFQQRLSEMSVQFQFGTIIKEIKHINESHLKLIPAGKKPEIFDACLVTSSPRQLAGMADGLSQTYLKGLLSLKHMGAVVLVISLRQQLSREGYYWFNLPKSAGFPFLALVEHTNYLSPDYFGGDHIIYIGDYLEPDHEHFNLSKDELLKRFIPSLARINPEFRPDWVKKSWLHRTRYAQPVPLIHHSENLPEIRTPIKGLYYASMSQVYPWDRGTNFAVEIGRKAARLMIEDFVC